MAYSADLRCPFGEAAQLMASTAAEMVSPRRRGTDLGLADQELVTAVMASPMCGRAWPPAQSEANKEESICTVGRM